MKHAEQPMLIQQANSVLHQIYMSGAEMEHGVIMAMDGDRRVYMRASTRNKEMLIDMLTQAIEQVRIQTPKREEL